MNTVRWNLAVSADTDQALRVFLAGNGRGKKGDLSNFVETAVRSQILELTAQQVKTDNANRSETELNDIVSEAITKGNIIDLLAMPETTHIDKEPLK